MAIITLTTDWGLKDHYAGAVKGKILNLLPDASIVDISHLIPSFDIRQASFVLRNAYALFPKGSIHIIGVNTEASIETPHVVVCFDGHYFIGADNGIFTLLLDDKPDKIIEIDVPQDSDYFTFSTRDVFIKAACHIAQGHPPEKLGDIRDQLNERLSFKPVIEKDIIRGKVIYIDSYGNVFVNISEALFRKVIGRKPFSIQFRKASYEIHSISRTYDDVPEGEKLALFSTTGLLEISLNRGKASSLLGLSIDDPVIIRF